MALPGGEDIISCSGGPLRTPGNSLSRVVSLLCQELLTAPALSAGVLFPNSTSSDFTPSLTPKSMVSVKFVEFIQQLIPYLGVLHTLAKYLSYQHKLHPKGSWLNRMLGTAQS